MLLLLTLVVANHYFKQLLFLNGHIFFVSIECRSLFQLRSKMPAISGGSGGSSYLVPAGLDDSRECAERHTAFCSINCTHSQLS